MKKFIHVVKKSSSINMTEGNILRHLIIFSIPLLVGNLFQQFYNTVDAWVVGNYVSNEAFSAVGTVGPIVNLLVGFFLGFSNGASVVISQYFGAKQFNKVKETVHTVFIVTILLGFIFTFVGLTIIPTMLRFTQTPIDVFPESKKYLTIYFYGILGLLVYNMGSAVLRAVGDSIRPFFFLVASSITNIILDLVFVLVFHTGVFGVALATIISEAVSAFLVIYVLFHSESCITISTKDLKINTDILKRVLKVGIPTALQMGITSFSNIFVQGYVNQFGSDFMSGWAAYNKIDAFMFLPMQSIALATTTFVGQNLGKGDVNRAQKGTLTALICASLSTIVFSIIVLLCRSECVAFFNNKPEVIFYGSKLILAITPFCVCCCLNQVLSGALRGSGDSRSPMLIMLFSFVVIRQIYLYICTRTISDTMSVVSFSYPVGWIACSFIMLYYYIKHKPGYKYLPS